MPVKAMDDRQRHPHAGDIDERHFERGARIPGQRLVEEDERRSPWRSTSEPSSAVMRSGSDVAETTTGTVISSENGLVSPPVR